MMAWSVMTGQEKAFVAASALFLLALVAAVVIGAVKRRRGTVPPPQPVKFVPHWQMMMFFALVALGFLAAIVVPIVARLMSR